MHPPKTSPIKCPACGSVFKAEPEKVHPAEAAPAPAVEERQTAAVARHRTAPTVREDADEDLPKPRKKAAARDEDEGAISPVKKKAVAIADDEDDRPARKKKRVVEDEEDEIEEVAKPAKRRTPWYVMLPLLVLSLCGAGLAALWTIGFSFLDMDRGLRHLDFDTKVWIGVASAGAVVLLCLIFSLIPARGWLRFLLVFLFLGLGYGGSFAAIHWWNDLPFVPQDDEKPFDRPQPQPGGGGPPGGGMGGGMGGRGAPMGPQNGPPPIGQGAGEGGPATQK